MIQFLGLNFVRGAQGLRAVATAVDRAAAVISSRSATVSGATPAAGGVTEVRPGEWVRAGSIALKEAFLEVPAGARRVWGFSLAGPEGWVALNPELSPLGPIRLTSRPGDDLRAFLTQDPRQRQHLYAVLSPKDYFRFAVSGALATDVIQAEGLAPLLPGTTRWSEPAIEGLGFKASWFPPVFDAAVATGRLSEEGIRHTGLPGGLWVVAGAASGAGELVSAADTRAGVLLVTALGPDAIEFRAVAAGLGERPPPEGFEASRAPFAGHVVLRRTAALGADPARHGEEAARATRAAIETLRQSRFAGLTPPGRLVLDHREPAPPPWARAVLEDAGIPGELSPFAGQPDPGIAFLAGIAQGAYRTWDDLYRKLRERRGG